jgi:hypothetical protein
MKRMVCVMGLLDNCLSLSSPAAVRNVPSEYTTIQGAIDASVNDD